MARKRKTKKQREVDDYRHDETRPNNPPAGMMGDYEPEEAGASTQRYSYDPHLDPELRFDSQGIREQAERLMAEALASDDLEEARAKVRELQRMQEPWLQWAGKAEHTSFEVENVPLYVHERLSTQAMLRAVRREEVQKSLFADPELPLREAVEFYQHEMDWVNRLILGDSLLVMNSLLERELMAGQVQMIYIDPPYGIGYNSNFQPRVDRRDVTDGKDADLTREPEQIKAYRDTWALKVHSYLTYLRDRLLLARDLLSETGSVFVQIGDENLHHVRELLDEVFGVENFVSLITVKKTSGAGSPSGGTDVLASVSDFLLWYARDVSQVKYRALLLEKGFEGFVPSAYSRTELADGSRRSATAKERGGDLPLGARLYALGDLTSTSGVEKGRYPVEHEGRVFRPHPRVWTASADGMQNLLAAGRIEATERRLGYVRFLDDFPGMRLNNIWTDAVSSFMADKTFVVQTNTKILERCIQMTTDPSDLVLDPTCGSGTTAYLAEKWGRRWITCDTSRVAVFLARQRLLTAKFDFYVLADEKRGVSAAFEYKSIPHITLKSIANNPDLTPAKVEGRREAIHSEHPEASSEEIERLLRGANEEIVRANAPQEVLYDQPRVDRGKVRVSGPFTVDAIPPPSLQAVEETPIGGGPEPEVVEEIAPSEEGTGHVDALIEELRRDGVTFPDNRRMVFASLVPCGSGVIHAEGQPENGEGNGLGRIAVSFGPRHGSVSTRQVEDGLREANIGGYDGIIFCGFAFDAESQATIAADPHKRVRAFMAHIRPDVLMTDERGVSLLKTTATSQLFTVFGEPEVEVREEEDGLVVELLGVDVYNPLDGTVSSTRGDRVAAWFLDMDYDGRTFCVCQCFFPDRSAWRKLGRALKGIIDEEKLEAFSGTVSLPFEKGEHERVAVKVIDHRGNEVMVVRSV